jgi:hypothetical protein
LQNIDLHHWCNVIPMELEGIDYQVLKKLPNLSGIGLDRGKSEISTVA